MQKAQLAIEDSRFYEHGAMDLRGTLRAVVRTLGGSKQGASTITQQYVKMVLLNQAVESKDPDQVKAAYERTVGDKVLELRYALALEDRLTKDEILERYLNMSYYGAGAYGVEAAARIYFNTSAKKLDLPQAAMLAGLVRNPTTTDPIRYEKLAIERRNQVLDRMADPDVAMITREEAAEAKKAKFDKKKVRKPIHGCANSRYPHLCQMVEKTMLSLDSMGPDEESRRNLLNRGGLTIKTELDPRYQDAAQKAVSGAIAPTDPVIATMVVLQPGTGLILAAAEPTRDGQQQEEGRDVLQLLADAKYGGRGLPGRIHVQGIHAGRRDREGHPHQRDDRRARHQDFKERPSRAASARSGCRSRGRRGSAGVMNMYEGARRSSNSSSCWSR